MKKLNLILCVFLTVLVLSCKKDPPIKDNKFVPGEILVGITANSELNTVFDTFNNLDFKIKEVMGFYYSVPIKADSLAAFLAFLNSKPYINTNGFRAYAFYLQGEGLVKNASIYFDLNLQNQQDLLTCIKNGGWLERHEDTKAFYLNIPVGTERYWLEELKKYPFVKWTELNEYMDVHVD